ncbi:hypothetical protein [Mycobacterium parmense]|uniref:Uncharacterized protein n=1 Tax=Mycobacterium parmense TaxID=185642 RepID=A0A7I7YTM2_9MYCO|nr:hypothetical protein [Mycobacterium parmense]MCV7351319.1 hypothetical protein [Mycobacterium parmense]ORW60844.1 hypothetical protein AWC20_07875 [Mycobacterium parmense]BBZ45225.1 hypothetical protein MPRM_25060 [Mycobacterium parmense]
MMLLAAIAALATATAVGYYFGRRAGTPRVTWRKRTSRVALGRLAISLLVLVTARRVQRSARIGRLLPDVVKLVVPLHLLPGGAARARSY